MAFLRGLIKQHSRGPLVRGKYWTPYRNESSLFSHPDVCKGSRTSADVFGQQDSDCLPEQARRSHFSSSLHICKRREYQCWAFQIGAIKSINLTPSQFTFSHYEGEWRKCIRILIQQSWVQGECIHCPGLRIWLTAVEPLNMEIPERRFRSRSSIFERSLDIASSCHCRTTSVMLCLPWCLASAWCAW